MSDRCPAGKGPVSSCIVSTLMRHRVKTPISKSVPPQINAFSFRGVMSSTLMTATQKCKLKLRWRFTISTRHTGHFDILRWLIASVPILRPKCLQADKFDMAIGIGQLNALVVAIHEKSPHALRMIAAFVVGGWSMICAWPGIHPITISIQRDIGTAVHIHPPVALSLFGRVENIAGETFFAPTVERGRADIEVSAEYLESFGVVVLREVFVERIEPSKLPRKVVMLKIFPIWAVDGGERPFVLAHGDES